MNATKASIGAVVLGAVAAGVFARRRRRVRLRGKVAIVCGASRGLGRAIARELARRGCKVAVCARGSTELEDARAELERLAVAALAEPCDLRRADEVEAFVSKVERTLGAPDVLVANAATITVGPIESLTVSDFDQAMDSTFKSALHPAMAVLPSMRARRSGSIVFISSIGGKIGVPHLAPYSSAKFAVTGLSEALRAEVAKDGVNVLTVIPGLMRTGSHVRGQFKGNSEMEAAWFGASATAPLISIDADRAARRIVRAIERRRRELVYTAPARVARRAHDWVPWAWRGVIAFVARLLPRAPRGDVQG
jgi:NAD(P)-dependent dehydrogenase (short-subunit alcohol dehydrogenase family)